MSTLTQSLNNLQMTLIKLDPVSAQMETTIRRKSVERTLSRIHQLRDELNTQLYQNPDERPAIHSPADAAKILDAFIGWLDHEELWVIIVDTRNRIKCVVALYKGSVNNSQIRVAEVFRQAILENAPSIILAHNHPSGNLVASPEDVAATRAIQQAGKLLDIELLDHLIISQGNFVSLKQENLGFS